MSKLKNPEIKLFGKAISLPSNQAAYHHHEQDSSSSASTDNKSTSEENLVTGIQDHNLVNNPTEDESLERETASAGSETLKISVGSIDELSPKDTISDKQIKSSAYIEMTMKKPEKILQCPRCTSMDTKFCYYNNYNVKQPRHFCKSCQRFWTAGGTMRNVAVGSGRRRNKGSCPSSPDLMKRPEIFPSAQGYGPRIYCFSEGAWASHGNAAFPSSFAVNIYPVNPYCISAIPGQPPMTSTNPNSPIGKHLRDDSLMQSNLDNGDPAAESGAQRYTMPNKSLKIGDKNDAATRSIRSINKDSFNGSCHFKAFDPILDGKNHITDNSLILQANPAAFSRSMNFHERS